MYMLIFLNIMGGGGIPGHPPPLNETLLVPYPVSKSLMTVVSIVIGHGWVRV